MGNRYSVSFIGYLSCKNILHTPFPFDEKLLPRLSSTVGKDAVLQVFLPQISHVNERHTPYVETEQEHITGIVKIGHQ